MRHAMQAPTRSERVLGVLTLTQSVAAAKEERRNILQECSKATRTGANLACIARFLCREILHATQTLT